VRDTDDYNTPDLEDLVARPAQALGEGDAKAKPKASRRSADPFDKFPRWWALRMKDASVGAFKIALLLLYLDWKSGGRPVVVSNAAAAARGVLSRYLKMTALLELETLGIIKVERRPRKSSLITVRTSPTAGPERS
jgi:hypothetical protein